MSAEEPPSERARVRRIPRKARYDSATVHAILDAGYLCHVGFAVDGQPAVVPTLYGRRGDELLFHGSAASRMLRRLRDGVPACLVVSLVDGLVLARSLFHSSMSYRSVVLYGTATTIVGREQKLAALEAISEHLVPGRWAEARRPSDAELAATSVLSLPIREASAKVSAGPPADEEDDYGLPVWAGVLPLRESVLPPRPDPRLASGIPVPPSVAAFARRRAAAAPDPE